MLLKNGANPNLALSSDGYTSLIMATQNGHIEIVKILLERGANPDQARSSYGMYSCSNGGYSQTRY